MEYTRAIGGHKVWPIIWSHWKEEFCDELSRKGETSGIVYYQGHFVEIKIKPEHLCIIVEEA